MLVSAAIMQCSCALVSGVGHTFDHLVLVFVSSENLCINIQLQLKPKILTIMLIGEGVPLVTFGCVREWLVASFNSVEAKPLLYALNCERAYG